MSTIAYGLGQGFASGADSVANAIATAERIKNNREQLRIANQYAQLAQDKWDMTKQKSELEIEKLRGEIQNTQKQLARSEFGNALFGALQTGNYSPVMYAIKNNQPLSTMFDSLGYSNLEGANAYSKDSILKFAGNDEKLAKLIEENPNAFAVVTLKNGDKKLIRGDMLAVETGSYKAYNDAQLQYLNGLQNNIAESMQLGAIEQKQKATDLSQYTYEDSIKTNALINPKEGQPLLTKTASGRESVYDKKEKAESDEFNILNGIRVNEKDYDLKKAEDDKEALYRLFTTSNTKPIQFGAAAKAIDKALYEADLAGLSLKEYAEANKDTYLSSAINSYETTSGDVDKNLRKTMNDLDQWKSAQRAMIDTLNEVGLGTDTNLLGVLKKAETLPGLDKALTTASSKLGSDVGKYFTAIGSKEGRAAFLMLYNAMLKDMSGSAVTANEFDRKLKELGLPGETSITDVLVGMKNTLKAEIKYLSEMKTKSPRNFSVYVGDARLNKLNTYLENVDNMLKNKPLNKTAPQSGTTMQGNRKSLNEIFGSVGGQ